MYRRSQRIADISVARSAQVAQPPGLVRGVAGGISGDLKNTRLGSSLLKIRLSMAQRKKQFDTQMSVNTRNEHETRKKLCL